MNKTNIDFDNDIQKVWKSLSIKAKKMPLIKRDDRFFHNCFFGVWPKKDSIKPFFRVNFHGSLYLDQFKFTSMNLEIISKEKEKELIISPKSKRHYEVFKKYIPYFFLNNKKILINSKELVKILRELSLIGDLFFEKRKIMKKETLVGLFGELLFLKKQAENNSNNYQKHISAWQKTKRSNNDFIYSNKEHEIKTTVSDNNTVKISSEYQLVSKNGNPVYLEFVKLKEVNEGDTLDYLINYIRNELKNDLNLLFKFNLKLEIYGYVECSLSKNKRFKLNKIIKIKVTDNFPKLSTNNIPHSVSKVSYNLDLSAVING